MPAVVIEREAEQTAAGILVPIGRAFAHQRGQEQHAFRAGRDAARQIFHHGDFRRRTAAAGKEVFQRPVEGCRAALHGADHVVELPVHIRDVEDARLRIEHGLFRELAHPCAGADVAIGVAWLVQARAARGTRAIAAADGYGRARVQARALGRFARNAAADVVPGQDTRHARDGNVQRLQERFRPLLFVDVHATGERRVRIIGVTEFPGEVPVDIVLDVHPPAGVFVDFRQFFAEPEDFGQGVVRVQPVAGEGVKRLRLDHAADLFHFRAGARIGMDDVRMQSAAVRRHGDASVHRAR